LKKAKGLLGVFGSNIFLGLKRRRWIRAKPRDESNEHAKLKYRPFLEKLRERTPGTTKT